MNYVLYILLLITFLTSPLYTQKSQPTLWQTKLTESIHNEVTKQVIKECLEGEAWWKNYFTNQLNFYPIDALNEVLTTNILFTEKLIVNFFLFQEGYTDNIGHKTIIYTNKKSQFYMERELVQLKLKYEIEFRNLTEYPKFEYTSDCFGTGHSFRTIFSKEGKIVKEIINLNLELDK